MIRMTYVIGYFKDVHSKICIGLFDEWRRITPSGSFTNPKHFGPVPLTFAVCHIPFEPRNKSHILPHVVGGGCIGLFLGETVAFTQNIEPLQNALGRN